MKKWLYKSKNTDLNIDNLINTTSGNSTSVNSLDNTINTEISEIQQKNTTLVNDSSSNSTTVNSLDNTINTEISEIQQKNTTLVNDIDLKEFSLEYDELISMENISELRKMNLIKLVKTLCGSKYFPNVCTMLARVAAAKPHSADIERLISASNLLKSPLRSTMNIETENLSLYINYNMPPLYGWDPRDTVYHWMSKKKHRVLKRRKGKEQSYFSGVFFEASGKNKIINSDDSGEDTEDKKKKNLICYYY
ncbi:uncharacterized protein LOC126554016 [Aphis gossypii]|uniref:uncharacterized protein LOC126554016 n=1 Tax=Aphis gossypii TaxID=80765 RepID=UPI0021593423|nr:uncharacterized protein LOC126554016 [Aphis gossypii]